MIFKIIGAVIMLALMLFAGYKAHEMTEIMGIINQCQSSSNGAYYKSETNECCIPSEFGVYERDQGTMTYFLFGKRGRYYDEYRCYEVDNNDE